MNLLSHIYGTSLGLLTDFYQLSMAYAFWKEGMHKRRAVFNMYFRKNPFGGGYAVTCGLQQVLEYLENYHFSETDLLYLASIKDPKGQALFDPAFLEYLGKMKFSCDVDAIPEGSIVFPQQPLLRVSGPIIEAQLLETPILNIINFQSLIATKAARIKYAAGEEEVMEFGLRRAHGIDGALSASRAAYIGGCDSTSNILAGKLLGIPVAGTHSHSWVLAFSSELEAFEAFARAYPEQSVFLVDTFQTSQGIDYAVEIGKKMLAEGKKLAGIRLDSGDLAFLSNMARKKLDAAGLHFTKIVASNDLDEHIISSLKVQKASIDHWGVGTKLVTAYDQPTLGGVYKLSAVEEADGSMRNTIKVSEQSIKMNNPGILQVKRFFQNGEMLGDMIYDVRNQTTTSPTMVDPLDPTRRKKFTAGKYETQDLLQPFVKGGKILLPENATAMARERLKHQLAQINEGVKRFVNPHSYPVGLESKLFDQKITQVLQIKKIDQHEEE